MKFSDPFNAADLNGAAAVLDHAYRCTEAARAAARALQDHIASVDLAEIRIESWHGLHVVLEQARDLDELTLNAALGTIRKVQVKMSNAAKASPDVGRLLGEIQTRTRNLEELSATLVAEATDKLLGAVLAGE